MPGQGVGGVAGAFGVWWATAAVVVVEVCLLPFPLPKIWPNPPSTWLAN